MNVCSVCLGPYTLKLDGTIRAHKRFVSPGKYGAGSPWRPCEGAGKPPVSVTGDQRERGRDSG